MSTLIRADLKSISIVLSRRAYLDLHQWNERPKIFEDLNPRTTTVPANGHTHFALSKKSMNTSRWRRLVAGSGKSFSTSGFITSQSVVQLLEHLRKNSRLAFSKYNVPKADRIRSILWRYCSGHLLCEAVGKIEVGW
jgi:hypothetical protein